MPYLRRWFCLRPRKRQCVVFIILLLYLGYYVNNMENINEEDFEEELITKKGPLLQRDYVLDHVQRTLEEALLDDKGKGCEIPKLDPFDKEMMKFNKDIKGPIKCPGLDWVKCSISQCKLVPEIAKNLTDVKCQYQDILYVSDDSRTLAPPVIIEGDNEYELEDSDFVKINCTGTFKGVSGKLFSKEWSGLGIGLRPSVFPKKSPPGRDTTVNIFILVFDSTSKNGFIRKMPKTYQLLTRELEAIVLNGYSVVGDGTPAALFPILTGQTELELPEARKSIKNSGHMDQMPFIFYKLKEDGYRTAYFEDMPRTGTFHRFNGFLQQPTDHYLRAFFMEHESSDGLKARYCVGNTPRFQLMLDVTRQFLEQSSGKHFMLSFITDLMHDDFNLIAVADEPTANFLIELKTRSILENTLLIVMGDHGPRYAKIRDTLQGKLEERLPLMIIRVPEYLKGTRPEARKHLEANADVLTTPHDIYATLLDAVDMTEHWNGYKLMGADLKRGLTLFDTIPSNRSCSEAAIEPHWCPCYKWENLTETDQVYSEVAEAVVDHINSITDTVRDKCVLRKLSSVQWVLKRLTNRPVLQFDGSMDIDGYLAQFNKMKFDFGENQKEMYQVKLTVSPGNSVYEATVTHMVKDDLFHVNTKDIYRTNSYNDESSCINGTYPHKKMFCYCQTATSYSTR